MCRNVSTEQFLRSKSHFYGSHSSKPLILYQQSINSASEELAVGNPKLLDDRQKLLKLARARVNDDGYNYKKGKSRSKQLSEFGTVVTQVKRTTIPAFVRNQRMLHLEDSLKDIDKQIRFKELRREQATNSRQYQLCDEITHDITVLKTQRYQEKMELKSITAQRTAVKVV